VVAFMLTHLLNPSAPASRSRMYCN
jgi:hypothetical protein